MSPYYPPSTKQAVADVAMGLRVDRSATSVAAISTKSIFTISGGNVIVFGIIGESTTGQAGGANAVRWYSTPPTGTPPRW